VRLDSESISKADGLAKLAIGDDDFLDLTASVGGEIQLGGTLDIKPVVKVDTVDGYPTFGLVKHSFAAASPKIGGNVPVIVSCATPASATITVKSTDPGDPEQTFRVAANGAPTGCAVASVSTSSGGSSTGSASTYGLLGLGLGLGLGLAAFVRRRRRAR